MIYKKEHFSNCKLNPFEQEGVLAYIICLYDPASPLIKGEQNFVVRQEKAAEIAKLEDVTGLFDYTREGFVEQVQGYLVDYAKSMEWALLRSLEETFWEYMNRLRQPVDEDKDTDSMRATLTKTKMSEDAKQILDMYRSELSRFYNNDEKIIEMTGKIKRFRPEDVAKSV